MEEVTEKATATNRKYQVSIALLVSVIILLFVQQCGNNKAIASYQYQLGEKQDSIKTYRDENGKIVETQRLLMLENYKQVEGLKKELNEMKIKKASVVIKYKSVFRVDTLGISFADSLPCDDFIEPFTLDSGYVKFNGTVTNKILTISNLEVPNDLVVVIGEKKGRWFAKDTTSVFVQNSNTHIKGKQLEPYLFTPKPKFYNSVWFKSLIFGAGLFTGVYIMAR